MVMERANQSGGLIWKLFTLPISIISGSFGLVSGAIGLGFWMAGGVLSYSLSMIGLTNSGRTGESSSIPVSAASEAMSFVVKFESEYRNKHPNFVSEGFTDALQRARREGKLLFVYLHSPENPDTAAFCKGTLCSEVLSEFVNENFVAWGGSVGANEGFKMSKSFKAARFPFCAVVKSANNQKISLLQKFEGPTTPEEMLTALQSVLEDNAPDLVAAKLDAEERRNNARLREEQDAAYQAALEADQARERQAKEDQEQLEREATEAERKREEEKEADETATREAAEREAALVKLREEKSLSLGLEPEKRPDVTQARERQMKEEQERLEREAAETERKREEEKEACETATREASEREAALVKLHEEKSLSLGPEPEKGPDVTQVLVRLPNGQRKGRRFDSNDTLQSLYDFVDSSGCLDVGSYTLVTFFPRVLYGQDKLSSTLKELGLHPQASLFLELDS